MCDVTLKKQVKESKWKMGYEIEHTKDAAIGEIKMRDISYWHDERHKIDSTGWSVD